MTKNVANDALENVSKELATASSNQYLDLLASVLSGAIQQPTEEHRQTILNHCSVNVYDNIEQDKFLLTHKNVAFMPEGGITAVTAKAKSGKSFLCTILCASVLGCPDFGLYSYKSTAKVLYIDTEQRRYNTQRIARRINVLLGKRPDEANPQFQAVNVSELMPDQRKAILQVLATGGYDLIVVDGIVDLCFDFNDNRESESIMQLILQLSHATNTNIVNVIHERYADGKMNGHAGSQLHKKCDDGFRLVKKNNIYEIEHFASRNAPIDTFSFVIDEEGIPRNANDIQADNKKLKEDLKIQQEEMSLRSLFRDLIHYDEDAEGVSNPVLTKRFIEHANGSKATYLRKRNKAIELQVLVQTDKGNLRYNNTLKGDQ